MTARDELVQYLNRVDATARPNRNPVGNSGYSADIEGMRDEVQANLQLKPSEMGDILTRLNDYGIPSFSNNFVNSGQYGAIYNSLGAEYADLLNFYGSVVDYNNFNTIASDERNFQRDKEFFETQIKAQKRLMALENMYDSKSALQAMNFEEKQADKLMKWQEDMSNTAYSRMMNDMVSSGVNPILAFNNGAASTPNGAAASGFSSQSGTANVGNPTASKLSFDSANAMDLLTTGLNSAVSLQKSYMDIVSSLINVFSISRSISKNKKA